MAPKLGGGVEEARLPFLLHAIPRWHPGAWAVPGVTLSIASLGVFLAALGYLNRSEIARSLFRLPIDPVAAAIPALILAAGVAAVGRDRPGPLFPRLWAIALTSIAGVTTVWAAVERFSVPRGRPVVHALAVSALLAAAVLALRLLKVYPHHWLVHHVSLIGLGVVLAVGVPLILLIETHAVKGEQDRLAWTIAALRTAAESLQTAAGEDWPVMLSRNPGVAEAALGPLRQLSLERWAPDHYVWEGARLLGIENELGESVRRMLASTVAAATSARAPVLRIPAVAYNPQPGGRGTWEPHSQFAATAKVTAEYHREAGRLFREALALANDADAGLRADAIGAAKRFDAHVAALAETWGRQWLAVVLAPRQPRASLGTLFDLPLAPGAPPASALDSLIRLPQSSAQGFDRDDSTCHRSRYEEPPYYYYRVDCYAYEAVADGGSARMLAEYRVVYRVRSAPVRPSQEPDELFLILPFTEPRKLGDYAPEVMQALYSATASRYGVRPTTSRGGPPTEGFSFVAASGRLHVSRATGVPGLPAVQVRVCSPACK